MPYNPWMTGQIPEITEEGMEQIYIDTLKNTPSVYREIFNVKETKKLTNKDLGIKGTGYWTVKSENTEIDYAGVQKGYSQTYTQVTRVSGLIVTWETANFDLYEVVPGVVKSVARKGLKTIDLVTSLIFTRAINGSYLGPDGVVLASIAHPRIGGGTQSNRLNPFNALSRASLQMAWEQLMQWKDDNLMPEDAEPQILQVGPGLGLRASEILDSKDRPDIADRATNVLYKKLRIIENKNLAPDDWNIICNPQDERKMKIFFFKVPGVLRNMGTKENYDTYYSDIMSFATGIPSDYRDVFFGYVT